MSDLDEGFKTMLEGIRLADEGRDQIMRGLEAAWDGRKNLTVRLTELQETAARLDQLVLDQEVAEAARERHAPGVGHAREPGVPDPCVDHRRGGPLVEQRRRRPPQRVDLDDARQRRHQALRASGRRR